MRILTAAAKIAATAGLAAIALPASAQPTATRTVQLQSAKGAPAGSVTLTAAPKGVLMRVEARGLTPGWHAIHVHAVGDCSDAAMGFKKSGGHTHDDAKSVHGLLNPQANDTGDLPNLYAGKDGRATAELFSTLVSLGGAGDGRTDLIDADGSALVIHAKPDDYRTQPIGGAGDRVACAVVK